MLCASHKDSLSLVKVAFAPIWPEVKIAAKDKYWLFKTLKILLLISSSQKFTLYGQNLIRKMGNDFSLLEKYEVKDLAL